MIREIGAEDIFDGHIEKCMIAVIFDVFELLRLRECCHFAVFGVEQSYHFGSPTVKMTATMLLQARLSFRCVSVAASGSSSTKRNSN